MQHKFQGNKSQPILKELIYSPVSERKSKLFELPVRITNDLVTDLCVRENLRWVLNMSYPDINGLEENIKREGESHQSISRDSIIESKMSEEPSLREMMMSSVDITNLAQSADITSAILNGGQIATSHSVEPD